ncbi:hypothetical protein [Corynebacterium ulcerans]|uniref:hypothetical protein n=1 Tax=Corynebacterium ulcerans TaxID=65058 RepID=UPI001E2A0326|nr:hypothetical protein [Corynebacterium ulcerans]
MTRKTEKHVFDDGGAFPASLMAFEDLQARLTMVAILIVETAWVLDEFGARNRANAESHLGEVQKVSDEIFRRLEEAEKSLEKWRECEALQARVVASDQFIKEARGEIAEMNEKIKEAEKRLKEAHEAREASEVKLSDLDPEEWEACKGMWVRGKGIGGEAFEGIIFDFDEDGAYVLLPRLGFARWMAPDRMTLLPDHQRAFSPDGGPVKVDHGQWEKTHAMEEEFDRIKKAEK